MRRFNHIIQQKRLDNPEANIQEESITTQREEHSVGLQSSFHYKTGEIYFSGSRDSTDKSYYIALKNLPDFNLDAQLFTCQHLIDTIVEYVDPSNVSDIVFALTCLEIMDKHADGMDKFGTSDISLVDLSRCSNEDRAKKSGMNIRGFNRNLFISKFLHFNEGTFSGNGLYKDTATVIPLHGFIKVAEWVLDTDSPPDDQAYITITIDDLKKTTRALRNHYKKNCIFHWNGQSFKGEETFYEHINKNRDNYEDKLWISNEVKEERLIIDDSSTRKMFREWLINKNFSTISEKEYSEATRKNALISYNNTVQKNKEKKLIEGKLKDQSDIFCHDVFFDKHHLQNLAIRYRYSTNAVLQKVAKKSIELLNLMDTEGKISTQLYCHSWGNRKYEFVSLLQNVESESRDIIFLDRDSYSLDMEASAANLLLQIGQKLTGNDNICPQLKFYVENKKLVRQQISTDCFVDISIAKRALTATLFGGLRFPENFPYHSQAAETLKKFKCSREELGSLRSHPLVVGLVNEVKAVCDIIDKKYYKRKTKEIFIPALFKDKATGLQALCDLEDEKLYYAKIDGRRNVGKVVSFAYMSLESDIMEIAKDFFEAEGYQFKLPLHDGAYYSDPFLSRTRIDMEYCARRCEEHIFEKTGFRVLFEVKDSHAIWKEINE